VVAASAEQCLRAQRSVHTAISAKAHPARCADAAPLSKISVADVTEVSVALVPVVVCGVVVSVLLVMEAVVTLVKELVSVAVEVLDSVVVCSVVLLVSVAEVAVVVVVGSGMRSPRQRPVSLPPTPAKHTTAPEPSRREMEIHWSQGLVWQVGGCTNRLLLPVAGISVGSPISKMCPWFRTRPVHTPTLLLPLR
jgi:hypothetical protein